MATGVISCHPKNFLAVSFHNTFHFRLLHLIIYYIHHNPLVSKEFGAPGPDPPVYLIELLILNRSYLYLLVLTLGRLNLHHFNVSCCFFFLAIFDSLFYFIFILFFNVSFGCNFTVWRWVYSSNDFGRKTCSA